MSTFLQYISYYVYITCIWADGDMAWKLGNTAVKQDIIVREHFTQKTDILNKTSRQSPALFMATKPTQAVID